MAAKSMQKQGFPLIRLSHAHAFCGFATKAGASSERLLRKAGLPMFCDDPSVFVPLRQAWALFDGASQLLDSGIGWHVGQYCGDKNLSSEVLRKIEHAPTLYQGLQGLVRLASAEASHLELGIEERGDDIVFFTQYSTIKDWPGYLSSQSYQLALFVDLIRQYTGRDWVPTELGTEAPSVPRIVEERFPGARIRSNCRMGYLVIPRRDLHIPAPTVLHDGNGEGSIVQAREFEFLDCLRALVEAYLPDGYPSARQMASLMGVSPRTLFRRLSGCRLTYQGVVDEARFEAARKRLDRGEEKIYEIARSVGFDDSTHFARMFRRVGGLSPTEYRRSVQL